MLISKGMGDVLPCCDPSVSFFDAIFSNSCNWCTSTDYAAQTAAQQSQGLTVSQVPACDPNNGLISNILSNQCNVSASDVINSVTGTNIPQWIWVAGLGIIGFLALKGK